MGNFQPMNVNFGLFPPLKEKIRDKKLKNTRIANRALEHIEELKKRL
jgi:methylenetetrahydrofolate--tRNA-(uracil-5-)-methyltransferase